MQPAETRRQFHTSQRPRKGQVTIPAEIRRRLGLRQFRRTPAPTPAEEHAAFAQAVADEVGERLGG